MLGMGVYKLYSEGRTGCMVYVDQAGSIGHVYLRDLQDPATGKIPPRMVDVDSDLFSTIVDNILCYLTPDDYEAAGEFLPDPEAYDFCRILDWGKE
jgi:6-phosphofructokinase 1